ncbi:Hypp332 [Branchiostoma lanceolatum]|uniref:Hypp332 protein n=1 Tax=Branchiostoma lanceolatum TaxID=7740 RepID=A0A8J9V8Q8_BRALA|nr:Hypp332 [Branchiostoma lanceolatum]
MAVWPAGPDTCKPSRARRELRSGFYTGPTVVPHRILVCWNGMARVGRRCGRGQGPDGTGCADGLSGPSHATGPATCSEIDRSRIPEDHRGLGKEFGGLPEAMTRTGGGALHPHSNHSR